VTKLVFGKHEHHGKSHTEVMFYRVFSIVRSTPHQFGTEHVIRE